MKPVKFCFDDGVIFDGFAVGTAWNGFDNVKVTLAVARAIDEHFAEFIASQDCERIAEFELDEDGLIDLSNGYATVIVARQAI